MCSSNGVRSGLDRRRARARRSAFTLIEVVIALFIMATLATMLYGIVGGSLRATSTLVEQQNVTEEMRGFVDLSRRTLRMLPPDASIDSTPREENGSYYSSITLQEATLPYDWLVGRGALTNLMFTTRAQVGGLSQIGLLLPARQDDSGNDIDTPLDDRWLPLVNNVLQVTWRYFDGNGQVWQDEWHDRNRRPTLIEMSLQPSFPTNVIRTVFYVPPSVRPEQYNQRLKAAAETNAPPKPAKS
jgi:prepilin-type N-terminal cleavage/methylation domain-containing protein